MSDIAIKAENVSKLYQLGEFTTGSLNKDFERWWAKIRGKEDPFLMVGEVNDRTSKAKGNLVWSLKDIDFEIKKGEAVGIIGRNGAGKSTLLKILTKVTSPTTGKIIGEGRIASLLEVGTGFHPELTGRENIFLNGAILGMKKWEILKRFDDIVEFSGVERYIDTPVKRYSSGMYVRLAFAVAAHLESEILIVDEVLAVGDAEFQKKCIGKMNDVSKGQGRTVLFVSHHMAAISALCTTGLYLKNGRLVDFGNMNNLITTYFNEGKLKPKSTVWTGNEGDDNIKLYNCSIFPAKPENGFSTTTDLMIEMEGEVLKPLLGLIMGFTLWSEHDYELAYVLYDDAEGSVKTVNPQYFKKVFKIPANTLAAGKYRIEFDVGIQYVKRVIHDNCDIFFTLVNKDGLGRKFPAEGRGRTSMFRPNWTVKS
ncbi:ABC transporter ATP-binding protein [uncultured Mucilaginibacter sp.]|uniref:ABC transporter ATP-binding protein n=1 Tax=uncultured Mucilaginibacter sp. TaxID=797541 RepID=UPI002636894E|nr:ABC transporter ATP-binding protein [uncultured Mucilaginibacter sp.]